ncbi:MAG: hypothetical protein K0R27_1463 [Xanthobacteraceae bacterium]|jgi:hypothetical protein|nr:hypothetical protein [Xanthobacteraceae bacterium]
MSNGYDDEDEFELPTDAVAKAKYRLRHEGVSAAVDALIEVCRDKKAPAPARATAGTTILRANGMLATAAADLDEKPPEELSAAEIAARIRQINLENQELAERRARLNEQIAADKANKMDKSDDGLFD